MKWLVTVMLVSAFVLPASGKDRQWIQAKLVGVSNSDGPVVVAPLGTGMIGGLIVQTNYEFATDDLLFTVATRGRKPLNLTVHKTFKVAIEGQKAYVVDDSGKTLKLSIVSKEARE